MTSHTPSDVLNFWFGPLGPQGGWSDDKQHDWFMGGEQMDARIRDVSGHTYHRAVTGELDDWARDHKGRLALVLLWDQFSRNLHRGSADAFAQDPKARALCMQIIDEREDTSYLPIERTFLYMPLEHSERMSDQLLCVKLMERNAQQAPPDQREAFEGFVEFADKHLKLIESFGRFPHRNEVLGRTPTDEERAFLEGGGARFGQ